MEKIKLATPSYLPYQKMAEMDHDINQIIETAQISAGYSHLLRLRVSQINGCAYCVKLHTQDAVTCGENIERIALTSAWKETNYFTEAEKAGFALAEAITEIRDTNLFDTAYDQALTLLGKEKVAAIEWLSIVMNAWNRIGISSQLQANQPL